MSQTSDQRVSIDDLPDQLVEQVINSKGFQKMLAYRKLADGVAVLKENDQLYDSMVESIRKQHSRVDSQRSVEEFFELFVSEIEDYTEGLVDEDESLVEGDDALEELIVEGGDE